MARREKNEYMRKYLPALTIRRRAWAVGKLGGKCQKCGTENSPFEFDHIDPVTKVMTISAMWRLSLKRLEVELEKCQLLCVPCHKKKTCEDRGWKYSKGQHGLPGSHRHCKCSVCLEAWRNYKRERPNKKLVQHVSSPIKHGSRSGYLKERKLHLEPCNLCREANNAYARWLRVA